MISKSWSEFIYCESFNMNNLRVFELKFLFHCYKIYDYILKWFKYKGKKANCLYNFLTKAFKCAFGKRFLIRFSHNDCANFHNFIARPSLVIRSAAAFSFLTHFPFIFSSFPLFFRFVCMGAYVHFHFFLIRGLGVPKESRNSLGIFT